MILPEGLRKLNRFTKNDVYKMQIELDQEKVEQESEFSVEELHRAIIKSCASVGVSYEEPYLICKQYESVFAILGVFLSKDWIGPYIKSWQLYYPNGDVEDLMDD